MSRSFWVSPRYNSNLPRQPVLVLSILTVKLKQEVFPAVQRDPPVLQLVPTASCPVSGHYLEESGSVISTSSLQVLRDTDKMPLNLLFSQLNSPSSQPALIIGDAPVHAFMALPWALSSTSIPSLSREPTLDRHCRYSFSSAQQRERIRALLAPLLLVQSSLEQGQLLGSCSSGSITVVRVET